MNWPVWEAFCRPPLCCFGFWRGGGGEEGGELGGGRSRKDETVLGGWFGQIWGAVWPQTAERTRARALALSAAACVRLVISLDSCSCVFFPSFLACKLPFLAPSLQPLPSFPLPFPRLSFLPLSPSFLVTPGGEEGRLPARSPAGSPSTGLSPLDSPPPSRDFGGEVSELLVDIYFFPFINPDEVFLSEPRSSNEIRAFWCPLPLRFGEVWLAWGQGCWIVLEIILSWLQSRESGTPALPLQS